jgi:hypothetical protein
MIFNTSNFSLLNLPLCFNFLSSASTMISCVAWLPEGSLKTSP